MRADEPDDEEWEDDEIIVAPDLTVWVIDPDEEPVLFLPDGTGLSWARPRFGFCSQRGGSDGPVTE